MATASVIKEPGTKPQSPLAVHRFTVEQYHRMIKLGFLTENDRVELLEGWIVDKTPQDPPHAAAVSILLARLLRLLTPDWFVRVQSPITLRTSEPEPDLVVVQGPEERYLTSHPRPEQIAIVVEVSDSSIEFDRTTKGRVYASARIPIYWVVDLNGVAVEVYSKPKSGKLPHYQARESFGINRGVGVTVGGRLIGSIPVRQLFPG